MSRVAAGSGLPAIRAMSTVAVPSSASASNTTTTSSTSTTTPTTPSQTSLQSSSSSSSAALSLPAPHPFAAAPDIIRAHQKDAYFAGTLAQDADDLVRRALGGRTAHAWAAETRTAAELAYWGLTAGAGRRTLGEEYCDLVEVVPSSKTNSSGSSSSNTSSSNPTLLLLPGARTRTAYVVASVLGPYLAGRALPGVRRALRRRLEARVASLETPQTKKTTAAAAMATRLQRAVCGYLLAHLDTLTSGAHVRAVTLALFYFTGAYYTLTTRLLGLRYVFTRRRAAPAPAAAEGSSSSSSADDVVGYEVLGALLVLQLAVQGYLHVRDTWRGAVAGSTSSSSSSSASPGTTGPVEVSLDHDHTYTANNALLLGGRPGGAVTHTAADRRPPPSGHDAVAARARGAADPAATPCGHVFCWRCIGDWVREKPECPLCRRRAAPQHILPLQAVG
ncbi:peroxisome biosynthesis protein, peroxin-10 [Niveomyces insectorum RCEF 264]|uniref:RING-type E3 ubiquitin transferase n=1 Tax=Niveomyces insectorum RCEF 264 TaxID=1081102 RepID=A0A167TW69_9HYPO|nr:peroxisome biosynthesis protein, peroxin-10 [Niveomyces insectorum RCEF 264]